MPIVKFRGTDPFRTLETLRGEINKLFDGSFNVFPKVREDMVTPSTDVWEDDENIYVETDLPGFDRKDIDVILRNESLVISAKKEEMKEEKEKDYYRSERYKGKYYREVDLPSPVDTAKVDAQFKNGVLNISLYKKEVGKSKEIKIKVE
jgi:HSP20 family protein